MKRCALPRFLALAVLLQGADARKLGDSTGSSLVLSARTGAELSSLLRAPGSDQAYPMPVDLERLEASVLRLSNETQSSRQYLKPMIKSIRKMLQTDLVPDMSRQYGLAQKMLKDASKGFDACKDPWNATQVELLRSQHQKCREEENDLHNRVSITCEEAKCLAELKEKKCQELKGANTYPHEAPSVCDKESSDASYEAHAKRVRDFYKQKIEDWNNKEMGCANATKVATLASDACDSGNETWSEKRTSCTSIQRMLDTSACDAWTEHYRCSKQNTCLAEATAAYMNANTTATTMQKSISLQWRAMKRIECLLDALELSKGSDDVAKAIDSCRQKMHNATSWVLSYPYYKEWQPLMPTAAKVCGGEPTFPQPGTRSYEQVNYVGLPKNASADACSADCCTKCGYFKCNSTTVLKYGAKTLTGFSQEECCGLPPKIGWKYDKWETPVCPTACGHKEEMEERGVFCWDNTNNVHLDDSACNTTKPAVKRRKCPGTPTCGKCEEYTCGVNFTSKVLVPDKCKGHVCSSGECCNKVCAESDCPVGFALRSPTPLCDGVNCSQATCCSQTTWAYGAWSTAPMSCPTDCGHKVQTVNRSVTCQDTTGRVVCEDRCDKLKVVKPPNSRVVCPATRPCPAWIFMHMPISIHFFPKRH